MPISPSYILIFQGSLILSHCWKERLWRTAANRLTSKQLSSWSPRRQQHHAVHRNSVNKTVGIFLRCTKTEIQILTYMSQKKQTYHVCETLKVCLKPALLLEKTSPLHGIIQSSICDVWKLQKYSQAIIPFLLSSRRWKQPREWPLKRLSWS